jgi:4-carboxymuconolactone decarboxylase
MHLIGGPPNVSDYEIRNPKARAIVERMFPKHGQRRLAQLERLDPELRAVVEDVIYGGFYAREVLDQRTRELCAVAALTIIGRPAQLRTHLLAALGAGATRAEIQEVITQMAVYGGFPATLGGLDLMEQVWKELDEADA